MGFIPENLTSLWYLSQAIGLLALAIIIAGTLNKNDDKLKRLGALGTFLYGVSFALIGGWVGAAMSILGALRSLFSSLESTKKMAPLFFTAQIIAACIFWKSPYDLLALTGSLWGTYVLFYKEGITMRIWFIPMPLAYIVYGLLLHAPLNVAINTAIFIANLITIYRMKKSALPR